jgi:hypothetical protein
VYCYSNQFKEFEIGGPACSTCGRYKKYKLLVTKLKGRNKFEDLGLGGRKLLIKY